MHKRPGILLILFSIYLTGLPFQLKSKETKSSDTIRVNTLLKQADKLKRYQFDSAMNLSIKAFELSRQIHYPEGMARALYLKAICLRKKKEMSTSEKTYLEAFRRFSSLKMDSLAAECLTDIGIMYNQKGNFSRGRKYCLQAASIFRKMPVMRNGMLNSEHFNGLVMCYYYYWTSYYLAGQYLQGIRWLDTIQAIRNRQGRADANLFNNYGTTFSKLGLNDSALVYFKKGLGLAKQIRRNDLIELFETNLGNVYERGGEFDEAIRHYQHTIQIGDSIRDFRNVATSHSLIARVLLKQGKYPEAGEHITSCLSLIDEYLDTDDLFEALINIGEYYKAIKNFHKAETFFRRAKAVADTLSNTSMKSTASSRLGSLYDDMSAFDQSIHTFKESRNIVIQSLNPLDLADHNFRLGEAITHQFIQQPGLIFTNSHLADSAHRLYQQALAYYSKENDLPRMADVHAGLGKFFDSQLNPGIAKQHLQQAIRIRRQIKDRQGLFPDLLRIASIFEQEGKADSALLYYKQYMMIKDSVENEHTRKAIAELELKLESVKKQQLIELLSKEKAIQHLALNEKRQQLNLAKWQYELQQRQLQIMRNEKAIQDLNLRQTSMLLEKKQMELQQKEKNNALLQAETRLQASIADKNRLYRNLLVLITLLTGIAGWLFFNRYRLKQKNARDAERNRIGSDLHDEIGSTLSSISMYSAFAGQQLESMEHEKAREILREIELSSQEMIDEMNDIIWTVSTREYRFEQIVDRIENYAWRMTISNQITFVFRNELQSYPQHLSNEQRKNIYLICKESINNAIKYARASRLEILLTIENGLYLIEIKDDGIGLGYENNSYQHHSNQYGLENMQKRASQSRVNLSVESAKDKGTTIRLTFTK